jgi:uncharacterized protein (DUF1697 family)
MALVVFLRAVNVGGRKIFQPAVLAKQLTALDLVSLGAAGTFVARKAISAAALRKEIARRLPFDAEMMICRAGEVAALALDQFPGAAAGNDLKRYVSVMAKRPRQLPPLPIRQPDGADWQVQVVAVQGVFALSLWRRMGRTFIYPNQVVEKQLGVPATTRNWSTIAAIHGVLASA